MDNTPGRSPLGAFYRSALGVFSKGVLAPEWLVTDIGSPNWRDISGNGYGKDFVVVGSGGDIGYSTDAVSWTLTNTGGSENWMTVIPTIGILWSSHVIAGQSGVIAYSNGGVSWNVSNTGGGENWNGSSSGNVYHPIFGLRSGSVIVGQNGVIGYGQPNSFTIINTGGSENWRDVCFNGTMGLFVAVGDAGKTGYSSDGKNWTVIDTGDEDWKSIATSTTLFVAVGDAGKIGYSSDGINWTVIDTGDEDWSGASYDSGFFIAVPGAGSDAKYSTDAISWNKMILDDSVDWSSVSYDGSNNIFISCGLLGYIATISIDDL